MHLKTPRPVRRTIHAAIAVFGATALFLSVGACSSQTKPDRADSANASSKIAIADPWSRETAEGQDVGGGFMAISNSGAAADRLNGGSSPVAREVQVHTVDMTGGVMRMRQLEEGLEIPAGDTVMLQPGGFHIMLMGLKRPLRQGEVVPITLTFEKAGAIEADLMVQPVGAAGPMAQMAGGDHD